MSEVRSVWYLLGQDRKPIGPMSAEQVLEARRRGEATDETLCWTEGMSAWQPVGTVAALASAADPADDQLEILADDEPVMELIVEPPAPAVAAPEPPVSVPAAPEPAGPAVVPAPVAGIEEAALPPQAPAAPAGSGRVVTPPIRIAGLRVVAVLAALWLLVVFAVIVGFVYDITGRPWLVRLAVVAFAAGYVGYTVWLCRPKGVRVTADEADADRARLYRSIERVAARVGVPVPLTTVVQDEDINAVTFGFTPKTAYISVTSGLLARIKEDDQLDAVMAHEVSHIINRDCAVSTAFHFAFTVTQFFHTGVAWLLAAAYSLRGVVAAFAEGLAWGGLIGLVMALVVVGVFLYLMFYLTILVLISAALLWLSYLAINAFSRQREKVADDYAAQTVGPEPVARAFMVLADADPEDRAMVCGFLGAQLAENEPLPVDATLNALRQGDPPLDFEKRLLELKSDHPWTLRRIRRVLAGGWKPGVFEKAVAPLARLIERCAGWLTDERRAAARATTDREAWILLAGVSLGVLTALVAAALPAVPMWLACLTIGPVAGLLLGAAVGAVLNWAGPFLGADVVDATLGGAAAWFITACGLAVGLLLPNGSAIVQAGWVVLLVALAAAAASYVLLPPGRLAGWLGRRPAEGDGAPGAGL